MSAMRISCRTPASIRRVLKVWRRSWKRTWRIPPFLSAVFQARFTIRTGLPRKPTIKPSAARFLSNNCSSRSVKGISRDSPSGVFERVTNSSLRGKSISSHRWLVISPRRMPVSSAVTIMTRRWSLAAASNDCSSATLRTWRRVRRSRAIFIRAIGFAAMS